jgi:hypothetical protein
VRHRTKYVDMPVLEAQAFVFNDSGRPGPRARSLQEFVQLLNAMPPERIDGHLRRHDFSKWINDVFRDRPLAAHLARLEARVATDDVRSVTECIGQAVRGRYEPSAEW